MPHQPNGLLPTPGEDPDFQILKPISKSALIQCVEVARFSDDVDDLIQAIRGVDFAGVLLRIKPGTLGVSELEGKMTMHTVRDSATHGGIAIRTAILTVLGERAKKFPYLHFSSSVDICTN